MPDCLIIEDETEIARTICEYFDLFGVSCDYATGYAAGLAAAKEKQPSLILLDVNLDGESGYHLCRELRKTSDVPILFISARDTDDDVLMGLGAGGDDFITKPFSMAVLLAKVKVMLRRNTMTQKSLSQEMICFADIEIDRENERVTRGGGTVRLKPQEFKLLLYLADHPGRLITKDELLEKVWQDTFIGEGTLSVHIRHLREKLEEDPGNPQFIKTMWGSGYLFEVQV